MNNQYDREQREGIYRYWCKQAYIEPEDLDDVSDIRLSAMISTARQLARGGCHD